MCKCPLLKLKNSKNVIKRIVHTGSLQLLLATSSEKDISIPSRKIQIQPKIPTTHIWPKTICIVVKVCVYEKCFINCALYIRSLKANTYVQMNVPMVQTCFGKCLNCLRKSQSEITRSKLILFPESINFRYVTIRPQTLSVSHTHSHIQKQTDKSRKWDRMKGW